MILNWPFAIGFDKALDILKALTPLVQKYYYKYPSKTYSTFIDSMGKDQICPICQEDTIKDFIFEPRKWKEENTLADVRGLEVQHKETEYRCRMVYVGEVEHPVLPHYEIIKY